jgi:hypothetical protein
MTRTGNVVRDIKQNFPPKNYNLTTAEGRANWDDDLSKSIDAIADDRLRYHASIMIREWQTIEMHII